MTVVRDGIERNAPVTSKTVSNDYDPITAAFYGGFGQSVYEMYIDNPGDLTPPPAASLPEGYEVVGYVNGVDSVGSESQTTFYGILAASPTELVVAFRGTQGFLEWLLDLEFLPVPFQPVPGIGLVENGFQQIYLTLFEVQPGGGGSQPLPEAIAARLNSNPTSLVVVGHSLGGALATLLACELTLVNQLSPELWTLGSPRVGDLSWVTFFDNTCDLRGLTSFRIYNEPDVVPMLPPLYAEVINPEEIDTTAFPEIQHSIPCYHSLLSYLYVLNPSNPFGLDPQCSCQLRSTNPLAVSTG